MGLEENVAGRARDRCVLGPAAARRRRHRLRQRDQRLPHGARVRARRRRRPDARGPGMAEALRPHEGQGSHLRRGDGAEDPRGERGARPIRISSSSRAPTCSRRTASPKRSGASISTRRLAPTCCSPMPRLSVEDIATIAKNVAKPLSVNMGFGIRQRSTTPLLSAKQLQDLGVAAVIYPRLLTACALRGMQNGLALLKQSLDTGEVGRSARRAGFVRGAARHHGHRRGGGARAALPDAGRSSRRSTAKAVPPQSCRVARASSATAG